MAARMESISRPLREMARYSISATKMLIAKPQAVIVWCAVWEIIRVSRAAPENVAIRETAMANMAAGKAWRLKERVGVKKDSGRFLVTTACWIHLAVATK